MRLALFPRRLVIALGGLIFCTFAGTTGYMLVEGMSWIDALYMTVITMSTVGYGEVKLLSQAGRLFTIGLILSSVGLALYFLTVTAEVLVEGRLRDFFRRDAMEHILDRLHDHVIVCGFGRFGRAVAAELVDHGLGLVIVEQDPECAPAIEATGAAYVIGSALSDEVLERAGIARARAIVVATSSDADNVFITLSAREHNREVRVHARAESTSGVRRLRLAGAHQVISSYQMGGQRVAASILRPSVVDFLEIARPRRGEAVDLEEVRVHAASDLAGRTIGWLEKNTPRVRVVALKRGEERIELIPEADVEISRGDHLVVIGASESLSLLARDASGD